MCFIFCLGGVCVVQGFSFQVAFFGAAIFGRPPFLGFSFLRCIRHYLGQERGQGKQNKVSKAN